MRMTSIGRICFALFLLLLALVVSSFAQEKSGSTADIPYRSGPNDAITDVPGVQVGHFTYNKGETHRGTTVILFGQDGGLCASEVRGGNPFTIDTDAFNPTTIALQCDAIVLTGGSAFGAAAELGVINYLFEHGRGVHTRAGLVPIVPAAVIYDLPVGDANIHPELSWGYKAAESAKSGPVEQGNVGAGAGGTTGKAPAGVPLKGGLGTSSAALPGGVAVGALAIVHARSGTEAAAGSEPVVDGLILIGECTVTVRADVAADGLVGVVYADDGDREAGVRQEQEAGVPAAQNGVGNLIHALRERAARADWDVPGSADAEVVARIEEATAAL